MQELAEREIDGATGRIGRAGARKGRRSVTVNLAESPLS